MSFSDNLRKVRKEKNMSQEELADVLGVSRQAVSKWESGEGYPEVEKLLIIAKELNVSIDSLMNAEILTTNDKKSGNQTGHITIVSPNEGVIVDCTKIMKSQQFLGGKNPPKYALFAQEQGDNSFWGPTNTFLGWYMTEESIVDEINAIHRAIIKGEESYELSFSVKCKKSFLSITVQE